MRGLEGKVAVVTGGGGGIGGAAAMRLAEEGVSVVVGDLNGDAAESVAADVARKLGARNNGRAIGVQFDQADEASVASLVQVALDNFGGIDFLFANAADMETIFRDADAVSVSLDDFDRTISVNLRGYMLCTRHVVPEMQKRGGGAIVYTSSAAAFIGEPERVSYAVSKSGAHALMRHVASRWGREGIRANAVAPGFVLTAAGRDPNVLPEVKKHALSQLRSPRLGEPEDIAATVAFLMSQDGEWITGQTISVDGGMTIRG